MRSSAELYLFTGPDAVAVVALIRGAGRAG